MKKKIFAVLTAIFLLCACLPLGAVSVSAATSGTTGDCTWTLDDDGHLTISGKGAMENYEWEANFAPWGTDITSVTIEDGVTTIGDIAFRGCTSLTSVTIGDSVTTIEDGAFSGCDSLTSVTIPDSVTTIGDGAFAYCESLTSITVDQNNPNYCSVDGVLFNKGKITLIKYPGGKSGAYTIPDSVTTIGELAFSGCISLTSVTIPDSVTTIGDGAFVGCDSLISVTIPDSVTTIGYQEFADCTSLTSITIPDSVTTIGYRAFDNCDSLTDVYYTGDETDRAAMEIDAVNDALEAATWHYNPVTPQPSDEQDDEEDNQEQNSDEDTNLVVIIVIAGLLAVIAVLLFLLLKKKKSA